MMTNILQKHNMGVKSSNKKGKKKNIPTSESTQLTYFKQSSTHGSTHLKDQIKKKVMELNDLSCEQILKEQYKQAQQRLTEVRKMLDTSSKETYKLNKYLMMCIKQNLACTAQGLWEFQQSLQYMQEAITYLKKLMKVNNFGIVKNMEEIYVPEKLTEIEVCKLEIRRMKILALYLLQLSAINSQVKNHNTAYSLVFEALKYFHSICYKFLAENIDSLNNSQFYISFFNDSQNMILNSLLEIIYETIKQKIDSSKLEQYCIQTHNLLIDSEQNYHRSNQNPVYRNIFSKLTISAILQIQPIKSNDFIEMMNQPEDINEKQTYLLVFYVALCFYILSTESRFYLISHSNHKKQGKNIGEQYSLCQIYHLRAISLHTKYIPYKTPFLSHLIESFKTKFRIDLMGINSEYINRYSVSDCLRSSGKTFIFSASDNKKNRSEDKRHKKFETMNIFDQKSPTRKIYENQRYMSYERQKYWNKKLNEQFSSNKSIKQVQKTKEHQQNKSIKSLEVNKKKPSKSLIKANGNIWCDRNKSIRKQQKEHRSQSEQKKWGSRKKNSHLSKESLTSISKEKRSRQKNELHKSIPKKRFKNRESHKNIGPELYSQDQYFGNTQKFTKTNIKFLDIAKHY